MLKVYCPYSVLDLGWKTSKNLQNITFKKPWYLKGITMSQEEKELLLKDLSARLQYNVILHFNDNLEEDDQYLYSLRRNGNRVLINDAYYVTELKPYLRPLSSMTEEEEIEYDATFATIKLTDGHYDSTMTYKSFDWLNANHFDYHNLIEKGLAIEVTEENNPYKV